MFLRTCSTSRLTPAGKRHHDKVWLTRRLVDLSVGTIVHTTISQDGLRDTLCVILNGDNTTISSLRHLFTPKLVNSFSPLTPKGDPS